MDELVAKIINHIDKTKQETIQEINVALDQRLIAQKEEIMREVNVLLEDQHKNFNTFGKGLDTLHGQMIRRFDEIDAKLVGVDKRLDQLTAEQKEIKMKLNDLDQAFEIKLRRVR